MSDAVHAGAVCRQCTGLARTPAHVIDSAPLCGLLLGF
ncbi:MAG: hypothetical protein H6R17_574 [Proteobacteria bacterium]|nr:hypothetical protein [Pseudomonadota bacterium]